MKVTSKSLWSVVTLALVVSAATALATLSPIEMQGDYIWTAIGVDGTLGVGGGSTPGLIHDPTGSGDFDPATDYVTPGSPFEGFSVSIGYDEYPDVSVEYRDLPMTRTVYSNNNASVGSAQIIPVSLEDTSAGSAYDHHVTWTGTVSGLFNVTHEFYFNDGDERINIRTSIAALDHLGNVLYQRIVDPDPDVGRHGIYDTINTRGFDANGDGDYNDPGDIPPESWVYSEGAETGRTLSLLTRSDIPHNTNIDINWSRDPADTLTGQDDGDGDYSIAMAFDIGDMSPEEVVELMYAYVMGATVEDIVRDEFGITKKASKPHAHLMAKAGMRAIAGVLAGRGRAHSGMHVSRQPDGQGWVVWGRQIGVKADKDKVDGIPGYDADVYHSLVGMEKSDGGYVGGLAFGIGRIDVDMDNRDESKTDVYTAGAYGSYVEELFYVDGSFVYGFHDTEESSPGRNARADLGAHVFTLNLAVGHEYPVYEWLSICPEIGGRATYYNQYSYSESGTSSRRVDDFDKLYVESSLGVKARATKVLASGVVLQPVVGVAWLHEFNDDKERIRYRDGGATGFYRLQAPEEDLIQTSASISATMRDRVQLEVGVVYEQGRDYSSFGLGGAVGVSF